jgi:hypothetical protein
MTLLAPCVHAPTFFLYAALFSVLKTIAFATSWSCTVKRGWDDDDSDRDADRDDVLPGGAGQGGRGGRAAAGAADDDQPRRSIIDVARTAKRAMVTPGKSAPTPGACSTGASRGDVAERASAPLDDFVSFAAPEASHSVGGQGAGALTDAEGDLVYREWDPLPWTAVPQKDGTLSFASLPQHGPLLRLHQEILQFAQFVTPTAAEETYVARYPNVSFVLPAGCCRPFPCVCTAQVFLCMCMCMCMCI